MDRIGALAERSRPCGPYSNLPHGFRKTLGILYASTATREDSLGTRERSCIRLYSIGRKMGRFAAALPSYFKRTKSGCSQPFRAGHPLVTDKRPDGCLILPARSRRK